MLKPANAANYYIKNLILQSLIVPFNIEQAVSVVPIGDYTIKDGIDEFNFKRI